MISHWREIKPGPFAKFKTSLKRDPSFHIPPWGQSNLNFNTVHILGSTHSCLFHSLTTSKQTCSKLSISDSASRKTDLHQLANSFEFHLLYNVYLYPFPIFYYSHKCSRSLHVLCINSPLVLDVTHIFFFFNQCFNFVHGIFCWLEIFNCDIIKFIKFRLWLCFWNFILKELFWITKIFSCT